MAKNLGQFTASSPYLRMPAHSSRMRPPNHAQVHPCNSTWVISNTSPWDFRSGAAWKPFNPVSELLSAKRWSGLPPDTELLMERCTMRELLGSLTTSLFSWKSLQKIASILNIGHIVPKSENLCMSGLRVCMPITYPFSTPTYLLDNIRHAC